MTTPAFTSLRRLAGSVFTLLLFCAGLLHTAAAQTVTVVSSAAAALPHTGTYGNLWQSVVSTRGDFVVFDFQNTAIYQWRPDGTMVTVSAPGTIAGGYSDIGIALDPRNNNIYLNNNYSGGLLELPYDAATGTWDKPTVTVASGLGGNLGGSCGNYFQSAGMAMNANGILAVGTENGCGVGIFTVPVDASGNFGDATPIASNLDGRPRTVALDNAGNIYFNEDGGKPGAFLIPAGTTALSGDGKGSLEATLTRVDPNLPNVLGVSVDNTGNVYVADGNNGVYLVPLVAGVPTPANAVLLTPNKAQGNAVVSPTGTILYEPVSGVVGISDVAKVYINSANVGAVPVNATGSTPITVTYAFTAFTPPGDLPAQVTPASYVLLENGVAATDFINSKTGTCDLTGTTAYPYTTTVKKVVTVTNTCTVNLTLNPHTVGSVTGQLLMLDANRNVLSTTTLQGTGQGSLVAITPPALAAPSVALSGLATPTQVALDTAGSTYIADAGLATVKLYGPAAGTAKAPVVLSGLKAPTGVAVDGAGDVFVADSGSVLKYTFIYPSTTSSGTAQGGLNTASPVTLASGLGSNLRLAADGLGDVYVTDPDNGRVLALNNVTGAANSAGILAPQQTAIPGFTAPSAITVDANNNVYVADGANLIQLTGTRQTTLLNSLSGATGIAVDPAGDLYIAQAGGTSMVPLVNGTFTGSTPVVLNASITAPASLALDPSGNLDVLDGTAKTLDVVNRNGALNLGTLPTPSSTSSANATLTDIGNFALNVSAFNSSNALDYTDSNTTCTGPVAPTSTCTVTVLFNPGPGEEGTLTGSFSVTSDALNASTFSVTGVGAPLQKTASSISAVGGSIATGVPVTVSVAPAAGATPGVPTGNVTVSVVNGTATEQQPVTAALVNGSATFTLSLVPYGNPTLMVAYNGDRTYGRSTATTTIAIMSASTSLATPTPPQYVLSATQGSQEPYSIASSAYTTYMVKVSNGVNVPTGTVSFWEGNVLACSAQPDPALAAGNVKPVTPDPYYNTQNGGKYIYTNAAVIAVDANGYASWNTNCLPVNPNANTTSPSELFTHTIVAVYNGDAVNAGSVSSSFNITVLRGPSVIISSNPPALTVSAGSTVTATLTLTSLFDYGDTSTATGGNAGNNSNLNNYTLPLEMQCSGLPARSTCSFSSNAIAVSPSTPGTVTMTINTNVGSGTTARLEGSRGSVAFAALFGAGLAGLAVRRRKAAWRARLTTFSCLLLLGSLVAGVSSCSSQNLTPAPDYTTPAGTYQVIVTAKQVGSATVPSGTSTQTIAGSENQINIPFTMSVTVH